MILLLGPLIIVGIIVAIVTSAKRSRQNVDSKPAPLDDALPPPAPPAIEAQLGEWVTAGLLRPEQASAISAYEQRAAPSLVIATPATVAARERRIPVVAEALGYLGGSLAIVGLGLVARGYWADMTTGGRLILSGGSALLLLGAGTLVTEPADPALGRLRGFLWLASTAAVGLFVGVLAVDAFNADAAKTVATACSAAVTVYAGLLWSWKERPLQQASCLLGAVTFAGAAAAQFTDQGPGGLAVWTVGAAFLVLGFRRSTPEWMLTECIGAMAMIVGAAITTSRWTAFGLIFSAATAGALLSIAAIPGLTQRTADQLLLGVIGGVAMLQAVPSALGYFSRDAGAVTGFITWIIGAALLAVGWRGRVRVPIVFEIVGGLAVLGGAALTGFQLHGFAPLFGITTSIALIAIGMLPDRVLMSVFGSLGLLVFLPWAIGWFFPGEGQAPRLILVSGIVIIAVAVLLTRMSGRLRREIGGGHGPENARWHRGAPPHAGAH